MSLKLQIQRHFVPLVAIIGLLVIAAAVGGYILTKQRFTFPWEDYYSVRVELPTAQAITPGQGQTVTVAGVEVGEISDVRLVDGRALVTLDINRDKLDGVYANAKVLVRPRTGLLDMTIDMDPGTPEAPRLDEDTVLPVSRSTPNVNVDEVLAGLDADVRAYVQGLIQGLGDGLDDEGAINLRELLKTTRPVLARTEELQTAIAGRRRELRRLVSNLASLSERVADQSGDLPALISQGNATFSAIAAEDDALSRALAELPGTLEEADGALAAARPLSRELVPTLGELEGTARELRPALEDLASLSRTGLPAVRELQGLTDEARGTVRQTSAAVQELLPLTPDLATSLTVLRAATNELAYNPPGDEEGYLFWLAWFAHNANSMLSTQDANGSVWRGQLVVSCDNVQQASVLLPILAPLAEAGVCPK